ncbi:MAG TPA: hypothetical protein VHC22_14220 [Pirellulales bacterium]|nr:hypothetical protein [Pirellulales bacterium]
MTQAMPRRFQFSLRALMVAVFVAAAFFGGAEFGKVQEQIRLTGERARVQAREEKVAEDAVVVQRALEALSALKASRESGDWADRLIEVEQRLSEANP